MDPLHPDRARPPPPFVVLHHGTTLKRAERIIQVGPDPKFVEPGALFYDPAEGFSMGKPGTPDVGLKTPEDYARRKAATFPNEGGPVILEIEVPDWIVDILRNDPVARHIVTSGEVRFEPGCGLDELRQAWPTLTKRIIPL